jgi:hypothetical protein
MIWILLVVGFVMIGGIAAFVVIARKGRELRRSQPAPPPAERAFLRWEDGESRDLEIQTPFYLGHDPQCHVVIPESKPAYEVCIFYHHSRFAFQTLPGGGPVLVNGEEKMAGYLWDGDTLKFAGREFHFLCY